MARTHIKLETKLILWGKAAGRCQYDGCNKQLYIDGLTNAEFNTAYIAHIIADSPNGPRGHKLLSDKLSDKIENLMLLCDEHHRLVDRKQVKEHTVERLNLMKQNHEDKMIKLTDISDSKESHIIMYGANIGKHNSPLIYSDACLALRPDYYPAENKPIALGMKNSSLQDDEDEFWNFENNHLDKIFDRKVRPILEESAIQNFSVFAVAPQPLLIKLGSMLNNFANVTVYANQKEPKTWNWQENAQKKNFFKLIRPENFRKNIALVFALSADIIDSRIYDTLGSETSIWKITLDNVNNDFIKHQDDLAQFRIFMRVVLNEIKKEHGESNRISVFPAMVPAVAVEFGRIWYPKADLPLTIYDQNTARNGFIKTIEIENKK